MNVYDFDGTIYDGESVFDFYLYSVKKQPALLKYLFVVVKTLIAYKLCRLSEEKLLSLGKMYAKQYLSEVKDIDKLVVTFWDTHQHKIKPYYLLQKREDDVVISATADFLLEEILQRIGVTHVLSTQIDKYTGEITQLCYRKTKAALFCKNYPDVVIENFYTDSLNDAAMMKLAKRTYLVEKNNRTLLCEKGE